MAFRRFNHLNVPEQWERYFTKYPQGMTILESLFEWVSQVDTMVDNQNKLNSTVDKYGLRLDEFLLKFNPQLQEEVTKTLLDWQKSGLLSDIIDQALQTQIDDVAEQLVQKADKKTAQSLQSQLDNLVLNESGTDITEVLQAKGDYQTLVGKIDSKTDYGYRFILLDDGVITQDQIIRPNGETVWNSGMNTIKFHVGGFEKIKATFPLIPDSSVGFIFSDYNGTRISGNNYMAQITELPIPPNAKSLTMTIPKDYSLNGIELTTHTHTVLGLEKKVEVLSSGTTKNLFNEEEITWNKHLDNGHAVDNSDNWKVSELIKVSPNTEYNLNQNYKFSDVLYSYFYDVSGNPISQILTNPFTTPINAEYCRFSIQHTVEYIQLERGSKIGYYIPYGMNSSYQKILTSKWLGKKYTCIGDSITDSSLYPIILARETGMVLIYDNGRAGTTVSMQSPNSMSSDERVNLVPMETEVITILGLANDWAQSIPIGSSNDCAMGSTIETELTKTAFGSYKLLLNKLYDRVPEARIILMEPTYRHLEATDASLPLENYREVVRNVSNEYGYPMINFYQKMGVNALNYTKFYLDLVHPNKTGQELMGYVAAAGFNTIQ